MSRSTEPVTADASKLRVARACLLGIRECARDADAFVTRGLAALDATVGAAIPSGGADPPTALSTQRRRRGRPRRVSGGVL